jgi:tetratricopeptide (TPR) repeat protein/predicted Ser/Thr protein kinase
MSDDAPEAGLSKYRLGRLLGEGGMGVVYLARDLTLDRDVALKFVSPQRISDEGARQRLIREAQAAAALEHPAICAVYDVEVAADGRTCIVMQYVEGETLADRLRRGPLPPRDALAMTEHIADALATAHRRGVIHRDLKPQNIILTPSGRPKLLDFGIASTADATVSDTQTRSGDIVPEFPAGTPGYMSPEQVHQDAVDGRSDLFSLGAVLFESLTGRRAFEARTKLETYDRVLHAHPPPVSSLQQGLTESHDELCRRLLAKDPADRFQSADELLGALRLLKTDTAHPFTTSERAAAEDARGRTKRQRRRQIVVASAVLGAIVLAAIAWRGLSVASLPVPPPDAERWYERARVDMADGAYYSAKRALQQAIAVFPNYVQAYTRLAEAHLALDEEEAAQDALLEAAKIVDPARLPADDGTRYAAVRAHVLHDPEAALQAWQTLATRHPQDPGAWLDLARAQEAAARPADARQSFEKVLTFDKQFAAGHLRLGSLEGQEGHRDAALAAFAEAERLYKAGSNIEGEIEVLLRRGVLLDSLGELGQARRALERARALASQFPSRFHEVRAQLYLSSVIASEGRYTESERLAEEAVKAALDADLDTVAAEGLIELGLTLTDTDRAADADAHLNRAITLARKRGAGRLVARATLSLASLRLDENKPAEALKLAESTLGMLRTRNERSRELVALSIISRAHEDLRQYARAREIAQQVLAGARQMNDESQIATALENLCSQSAALGLLPEALAYRQEAEPIFERQQNAANLAYSLANRAELLIRLGRGEEAEAPLGAIEKGAAAGVDAYKGRMRRVLLLRALRATTTLNFDEAARLAESAVRASGSSRDSTWMQAAALLVHATAQRARKPPAQLLAELDKEQEDANPGLRRELRYWRIATHLASGDTAQALKGVTDALARTDEETPDELQWRLGAMGAVAARRLGDLGQSRNLAARAATGLAALRKVWGAHAVAYEQRPDLRALRNSAGMDSPT